jgi:hypothetical protein
MRSRQHHSTAADVTPIFRKESVLIIHLEDMSRIGYTLCSGQPFALYSNNSHPKTQRNVCAKCLKKDNQNRQMSLW